MKQINNSLCMKIPLIGMIKELKRYRMHKYMKIRLIKYQNKMIRNKNTKVKFKSKINNQTLNKMIKYIMMNRIINRINY